MSVPEWLWTMHRQISRYAVPFSWGPPIRRGEPIELHGATCVAVELGDDPFLITAAHVLRAALEASATPGVACIAGRDTELDLLHADTYLDPTLDIATV